MNFCYINITLPSVKVVIICFKTVAHKLHRIELLYSQNVYFGSIIIL